MQILRLLILSFSLLSLVACGTSNKEASTSQPAAKLFQTSEGKGSSAGGGGVLRTREHPIPMEQVSLKQADQSQSVAEASDRKIIKDAELTLEVNSPLEAQRKVDSIAEAQGGFVVTSESKLRQSSEPSQRLLDVTLVLRVPAQRFGSVLDQIRQLSNNITDEKKTGQDVTEEFIDLEARIKTQVALEAQFLEIMKQAHKVEDALEVQRQVADVRTEIEKLEGRKRFLENRSSLSTITVNLQSPTTIVVSTSGFGRDLKEALKESVDVARAIVLFLIRFVIVMIPVFIFIILPLGLVGRYLLRRARRANQARASQAPVAVEPA